MSNNKNDSAAVKALKTKLKGLKKDLANLHIDKKFDNKEKAKQQVVLSDLGKAIIASQEQMAKNSKKKETIP
ncbi:MAG: hypothetical protein COB50_03905, partial [Thiotrichales bacterium]